MDRPTDLSQASSPLRLVQISDTHLCRWEGPLRRNFLKMSRFINTALRPDLVINSGDIVLSNPDGEADYAAAAELHEHIAAPVRYLPGNHDVGEAYDHHTWWGTTSGRIARYRRFFGEVPWLEWLGDVALVGLNSQVFGCGLAEEEEQWRWLESTAADLAGRRVIVFQHMSFLTPYSGSNGRPGGISSADRERVLETLKATRLLCVSNGNVHRYRRVVHPGLLEIWAPPTGFLVHDEEARLLPAGLEQLGVVLFEIDQERIEITFQSPADLENVRVGEFPEARLIRSEIAAAMEDWRAESGSENSSHP